MPTITLPKESLAVLVEALPKGCHRHYPEAKMEKDRWRLCPTDPSPLANLAKIVAKSKSAAAIVLEIDPCHATAVRCTVQDCGSEWPEYTFPPRVSAGIEAAARLALNPPPPKPGPTMETCILARVATTDPMQATGLLPLSEWDQDPRFKTDSQDKRPCVFVPLVHPVTKTTAWLGIADVAGNPAPHWIEAHREELQNKCTTENAQAALHSLKTTLDPFAFTPRLLGWLLQDAENVWLAFVERDARYKENANREEKEREDRREAAARAALAKIETDWAEGRPIPAGAFEDKAKAAGYVWNIRTLGAYRKSVSSVAKSGSVTFGHKTGKLPPGVSFAIFDAIQAIARAPSVSAPASV
jgi:hypothetical protein